jgi:hypothetical protein
LHLLFLPQPWVYISCCFFVLFASCLKDVRSSVSCTYYMLKSSRCQQLYPMCTWDLCCQRYWIFLCFNLSVCLDFEFLTGNSVCVTCQQGTYSARGDERFSIAAFQTDVRFHADLLNPYLPPNRQEYGCSVITYT